MPVKCSTAQTVDFPTLKCNCILKAYLVDKWESVKSDKIDIDVPMYKLNRIQNVRLH